MMSTLCSLTRGAISSVKVQKSLVWRYLREAKICIDQYVQPSVHSKVGSNSPIHMIKLFGLNVVGHECFTTRIIQGRLLRQRSSFRYTSTLMMTHGKFSDSRSCGGWRLFSSKANV
jgi:hypothetical protein